MFVSHVHLNDSVGSWVRYQSCRFLISPVSTKRSQLVQLLHKLSIRGVNGPEKLLKVVKNPIVDHLPPNTIKISPSPLNIFPWQKVTLRYQPFLVMRLRSVSQNTSQPCPRRTTSLYSSVRWLAGETTLRMLMSTKRLELVNILLAQVWLAGRCVFLPVSWWSVPWNFILHCLLVYWQTCLRFIPLFSSVAPSKSSGISSERRVGLISPQLLFDLLAWFGLISNLFLPFSSFV